MEVPKAKYDMIYHDLKQKIEDETYAYQELLPSEHMSCQNLRLLPEHCAPCAGGADG